ncbi:MAG: hypothetical protein MI746_05145 [Pseudomonadales bacterium]|nr:hypothetical protein [Pseudomonadales bacterium]
MVYTIERKEPKAIEKIQFTSQQSNSREYRFSPGRLILCLLTLLSSTYAWAQSTGSTSFNVAVPDPSPTAVAADYAAESFVPLPVTLLPEDYNRYDNSQVDDLVLQGDQQQEAGLHEAAVKSFDMAWQASRVSNGLFNVAQVPLLERMIMSQIELEDWQAVDNHYAYLELIFTKLYDTNDARLEAGLQAVSSWHVNAYNLNLDGKRQQHMRKAHRLLKLRLEVAENTLPPDDPKFEFLHESIRLSEMHLYLMSERYKDQLRKQERAARDRLLATLD